MLNAADIVVWVNRDRKEIRVEYVTPNTNLPHEGFCDPIGAAYSQWRQMDDDQRVVLMLETAIDLAMQGYALDQVLKAFAEVREFRALANKSYPMCRALTKALVGRSLEPNTMSFEELLEHYPAKENSRMEDC
jgi:hypothetical protein